MNIGAKFSAYVKDIQIYRVVVKVNGTEKKARSPKEGWQAESKELNCTFCPITVLNTSMSIDEQENKLNDYIEDFLLKGKFVNKIVYYH